MASINKKTEDAAIQDSKEDGLLFFGNFNKEECGKYFRKVNAVKFMKLHSKDNKDEELDKNDSGREIGDSQFATKEGQIADGMSSLSMNPSNQDADGCFMPVEINSSSEELQDSSKVNDEVSKTEDEIFIGKSALKEAPQADQAHCKEEEKDDQNVLTSQTAAVKSKPNCWADLFKSESSAPVGKSSAVLSVQFEDTTSKVGLESKTENLLGKSSKIVSLEKDENALALADFLEKTSLHPGNAILQLRGLINTANWCYINATLQSLLGCPAFYRLFKSMASVKQTMGIKSATPLTDTITQFANEFSILDSKVFNQKGKKTEDLRLGTSFEPKQVYEVLATMKSTLSETGKQQDAEEFLTFLLNGLHDEFTALGALVQNRKNTNNFIIPNAKLLNGNIEESNLGQNHVDETEKSKREDENAADQWEQVGRNNKSASLRKASCGETLITRLFGGIIRSSVHHAGAKESATLQPFFTIQLDIQAENIWNIKDAFENYFNKESIEGFTSSKTKSKVEASHKTSLEKLPQVLILHLKYFVYDKTGGCQKTHKHIEISRELEIPKEVLSSSLKGRVPTNQRTYELFAVEFHLGKHAADGHYTTAVKHKEPVGWVYCNDSIIQKTQFNHITKHQKDKVPYLLYYERSNHFAR